MPELSLLNIDQIANDVRREEITFSHLLDDLIDHVCCDVEYEMQQGYDFTQAYLRVRKKMGSQRRLREIQEETLYAVDTKYRKMKNLMKFSAISGTIIFGFATLFKIQHWAGAGIMMTLGAFILAFLFMPAALVVLWKETHSNRKILMMISGFLAGFLFIAGTLFKIQHWPGAGVILVVSYLIAALLFIPALLFNRLGVTENRHKWNAYITGASGLILYLSGMIFKIQHWPLATVLMVIGIILLGAVAFPMYTWSSWKDEEHVKPAYIFLIVAAVLIVIPGALINLSLQSSYDTGYFKSLEKEQSLYNVRFDMNQAFTEKYSDSLIHEKLVGLREKTLAVIKIIEKVESDMILASEGDPGNPAESSYALTLTHRGTEIDFSKLASPFHTAITGLSLLPGTENRQLLDASMGAYYQYVSEFIPADYHLPFLKLLDPSALLPEMTDPAARTTLMSGLNSLEVLKNNIITVEATVLKAVVNK